MKQVIYIKVLFAFIFLYSCQKTPEDQVASTAKSFAESFCNLDFENALELSTMQSAKTITFFASNIKQDNITMMINGGKAKVEVIETVIEEDGNTAKVRCKITNYMKHNFIEETASIENEKEEIFHLIKSGNNWLVDLK